MVNFLTIEQDTDLNRFIRVELSYKYGQRIDIEDAKIVTGILNQEKIVEAIKIRFFPEEANVEYVEDRIAEDIHRYCFENGLNLSKELVIERDVWLGRIRYGLVYTYMGDPVNCEDCRKLCKHKNPVICESFEAKEE